jgi:hypothetical protein
MRRSARKEEREDEANYLSRDGNKEILFQAKYYQGKGWLAGDEITTGPINENFKRKHCTANRASDRLL